MNSDFRSLEVSSTKLTETIHTIAITPSMSPEELDAVCKPYTLLTTPRIALKETGGNLIWPVSHLVSNIGETTVLAFMDSIFEHIKESSSVEIADNLARQVGGQVKVMPPHHEQAELAS